MMRMFDAHAHLTDEALMPEIGSLIGQMQAEGILALSTAFDAPSCESAVRLAESYDGIWAACGLHPNEANFYSEEFEANLRTLLQSPKAVAIGEIGLDYYWDECPKNIQWAAFERQIGLAGELGLPIIVHCREAASDTFSMIKNNAKPGQVAVLHAFSQSEEMLHEYAKLKADCYFSLAGTITFKNASKLRKTAASIRKDRQLVETDCPYLTPHPFRGKQNSPLYLKYTLEAVSGLFGEAFEESCERTLQNSMRAFGII